MEQKKDENTVELNDEQLKDTSGGFIFCFLSHDLNTALSFYCPKCKTEYPREYIERCGEVTCRCGFVISSKQL